MKLHNLIYKKNTYIKGYLGLEGDYDNLIHQKNKRFFLGVTIGRSGTRWHSEIFSGHNNAIGACERYRDAEVFYRYVKWNKLNIDIQGVINITKDSIVQDWKSYDISFVTSPFLSHDILYLYEVLKPEYIIWGVNDPKFTVSSFYNKGWYKEDVVRADDDLINGFQPTLTLFHNFSRLVPRGKEFEEWKQLTRIGKISWLYGKVNMEIYNDIIKIPKDHVFIFKLEEADQNYEYYLQYAEKFGLNSLLNKKQFLSIKKRTVRRSHNIQFEWSKKEKLEFEKYTNEFYQIYKSLKN